jgi:type IV pilus assembly protein PilC
MSKKFNYTAKTQAGQPVTGTICADSSKAAVLMIRAKGYYLLKLQEQKATVLKRLCRKLQKVSRKELALFCRLFSTMAQSGVSYVQCLKILQEQTRSPQLKSALTDIYGKICEGRSLAQTMNDHNVIFPVLMLGMVEIGEAGGVLDQVLAELAAFYEKESNLNAKLKTALAYPAMVALITGFTVIFILTFILPTFSAMFAAGNVELPLPTKILLRCSKFLTSVWWCIPIVFAAISAVGLTLFQNRAVRQRFNSLIYQIPFWGELTKKIDVARITFTLSLLHKCGTPILTALDLSKKVVANTFLIQALSATQTAVCSGEKLSAALARHNLFSPMAVHMIAVGEEAGKLDEMLDKIAEYYETEVEETLSRCSVLLEPFLILLLGTIIGGTVLSVVMPIVEAVTHIGE